MTPKRILGLAIAATALASSAALEPSRTMNVRHSDSGMVDAPIAIISHLAPLELVVNDILGVTGIANST